MNIENTFIPKIEFVYSWIYDSHWRFDFERNGDEKEKNGYPESDEIEEYLLKVAELWKKDEGRILQEMAKISGLEWKRQEITCYVVGYAIPFSDPLTIPIYKNYPDYFVDVLTHELIHNLFIDNEEKLKDAFDCFHDKYSDQSFNTRIHIPVHAIHTHIYKTVFNEERLKREKMVIEEMDYINSWTVVDQKGYLNIIEEFKKRIIK